ncbi:MAG: 5'/3'-nucleotidase SurE [Vulcanimicrobiaceae bacterium]|jgi:5'-nucleotidase
MRILVTNDDGVESPGIVNVAEALRELGDVIVVAPDGDRSAISHRVTFRDPVSITPVSGRSVTTYACSGTPADCVILGAYEACGAFPDLLVSGINCGANVGDDINYSGTVAAAIEGSIIGIPSIAVSLAIQWGDRETPFNWQSASDLTLRLVREWRTRLPQTSFLNLNVPNVPDGTLRGIRVTRQGRKRYEERLHREEGGEQMFRIYGRYDMNSAEKGTDLEAVREGYASVTPISIDRTDDSLLALLRSELEATAPT